MSGLSNSLTWDKVASYPGLYSEMQVLANIICVQFGTCLNIPHSSTISIFTYILYHIIVFIIYKNVRKHTPANLADYHCYQ